MYTHRYPVYVDVYIHVHINHLTTGWLFKFRAQKGHKIDIMSHNGAAATTSVYIREKQTLGFKPFYPKD